MLSQLVRPVSVGRLIGTTLALIGFGVVIFSQQLTAATEVASGVYTLNADFDKGSLINVVHTPSDQLQLTEQVKAFNFIWVANSGEGTIVKINTDTGAIVGEYRTSPNGTYGNPSRTTVDKDGSVWVGNRQAVSGNNAAITHVGLLENGQCEDRNGNNIIETSTGLNDVRDWTDASGARGVATAQDECIVHFTPINSYDARHISVDSDNNIWVSGINNRTFFHVKGGKYNVPNSGSIVRTEAGIGYGGYGGLISGDIIWSANPLLRWDTNYPLSDATHRTTYNHDSYGLCKDSQGNVWNTSLSQGVIRKFNAAGDLLGTYPHGATYAQGCVVDGNDHVWVAHSLWGSSVGHLLNDGTLVGVIPVDNGPTGVAVDHNGKIWVTHYSSPYTVKRIDPSLGGIGGGGAAIGAVDYTSVDLGGSLYNYSDMTGSTLSGKAENGTWTVVHDGMVSGQPWKDIAWTADVPADGALSVTIATSDDGVTFGTPQAVTNGQSLSSITSRYLQIVVSFERGDRGVSPILYDLTVNSITKPEPEPEPEPEPTPAVLGEETHPALSISKSVDASFANPKQTVTYTIMVANTGDGLAENVTLIDTLPAGLQYTDTVAPEKAWELGDIAVGETKTITYDVIVLQNTAAGTYVNTVVGWADDVANVTDTASLEVRIPVVLGAETLPVTGGSSLMLIVPTLVGLGAVLLSNRKRK